MNSARTFHIYSEGKGHYKVLDADKTTLLYHTQKTGGGLFKSKADLEIFRPDATVTGKDIRVGSVTHRHLSSTLDIEIGNHHVEFRTVGNSALPGSHGRAYESPRAKVGWVTWEGVGRSTDIMQMMETKPKENTKVVLAQLEKVSWARSKVARLQIYGSPPQELLDEIVVTVAAMTVSGNGKNSNHKHSNSGGVLVPGNGGNAQPA